MATQAEGALAAYRSHAGSTRSIVHFVREHGGDTTPDTDWDTKFYYFPDGSWLAAKGPTKARQYWTGPAE